MKENLRYVNSNIKTYVTSDYSLFKHMLGNRGIVEKNVKDIIDNIQTNGLKPTIIIVNEKMEIVDGQHRLEALKRLELPVYFQKHTGLTVEDCIALNKIGKKWDLSDFIASYCQLGYEQYLKFIRIANKYKELPATLIYSIMLCNNGATRKSIRSGKLFLKYDEGYYTEKINYFKDLYLSYSPNNSRISAVFTALSQVYDIEGIDKKRLRDQFIKHGTKFASDSLTIYNAVEKIEEIYNRNMRSKLYFVDDYKRLHNRYIK